MQSAPAPGSSASGALMKAWTTRGPLAWLLWPLSLLYGLLVAARRWAYQTGIFKSRHAGAPVLVVGNVVAGGAGKTPVVMLLVAHFQARAIRVGVVSRGYGRSTLDCREVLPQSLAQDVGDEPKLVQQTTGAPVFVARKRYEAAAALLAKYPRTQLVICDDGLQHLALHRDLEICVFDDRGVGNGFLLPAGPLREPWPRKVDFILHSGRQPAATGTPTGTPANIYAAQRRLADYALSNSGAQIPLAILAGKPVVAVAAIAQPENFFAMLRLQGLTLAHTIALPDHYNFDSLLRKEYETYTLVCTEKDAVKLWPLNPDALAVQLVLTPDPGFLTALDLAVDGLLKATAPLLRTSTVSSN